MKMVPIKIREIIRKIYLEPDESASFTGLNAVLKAARKIDPSITIEQVQDTLREERTYSLHKPRRIHYPRLKTLATGLNSDWQSDLADFQNLKRYNKGYGWLLVCIDVLSRKIYAEPIKTKEAKNVREGFEQIFKRANVLPTRIISDRGREFEAPSMKKFFADKGIVKHVVYSDDIHAGIVERANRTIKSRLYKYLTQYNTYKWFDIIYKIVDAINNSVNRGIGQTPNSVTPENAGRLYDNQFKNQKKSKSSLKVGDIVRMDMAKGKFEKSYLPNFTEELFRIKYVKDSKPVHYKLEDLKGEDILGVFYNHNIVKTNLEPNARIAEVIGERVRNGKKELLVHWIGEKNDEWIKDSDQRYADIV
jgi:hypothetical protein